jgi:xanthine dehydrogenase YagR molybdenum-binding subunit
LTGSGGADIPEFDVLFVGGFDEEASPLGAKGLGELTAVSVAPAIANAVCHATGKRILDLPITVEKLL